jgi:hypothetical protein
MKNKFIPLLAAAALVSACAPQQEVKASSQPPQAPAAQQAKPLPQQTKTPAINKGALKEGMMTVTGRLEFMSIEGGFFGIVTDQGQKLLPLNLKPEYHQHGMRLEVTGKIETDIMTIQQWGTPFTISSLKVLAPGKKPGNNLM